jgi:hypothetical protein
MQMGMVQPMQMGMVQPMQMGMVRPMQMGMVQPMQMGMVQPMQMGMVRPMQMGMVQPMQMGMVQPMQMGMVRPMQMGMVQPMQTPIIKSKKKHNKLCDLQKKEREKEREDKFKRENTLYELEYNKQLRKINANHTRNMQEQQREERIENKDNWYSNPDIEEERDRRNKHINDEFTKYLSTKTTGAMQEKER